MSEDAKENKDKKDEKEEIKSLNEVFKSGEEITHLTVEQLTITNMFEIQAMFELLEEKGFITQDEFIKKLDEISKASKRTIN